MPQAPLFTIVSIVLNDPEGLRLTANSVFEQTEDDYEWVVVDGGSDELTLNVLRTLPHQQLKIVSEKDEGIYDAMNHGIDLATGKYLVFLNSGDKFDGPCILRAVADLIGRRGQPDIVFGGANLDFGVGAHFYRPPRHPEEYVKHGMPAMHQSIYVSREFLGRERYKKTFVVCGDYDLIARLMVKRPSYACLDQPISIFAIGGRSYECFWVNMFESVRVQREILNLPLLKIVRSMLLRSWNLCFIRLMFGVLPKRLVRAACQLKSRR